MEDIGDEKRSGVGRRRSRGCGRAGNGSAGDRGTAVRGPYGTRRCATNRVCVVRANSAGLAIFTVRLTRVGRTTVTAIGLTPQRTIQTLSASVRVLPRRGSGRSGGAGSNDTAQAPAPGRAPATPMTAAGLLLTSVAGLALRRRQQLRAR